MVVVCDAVRQQLLARELPLGYGAPCVGANLGVGQKVEFPLIMGPPLFVDERELVSDSVDTS